MRREKHLRTWLVQNQTKYDRSRRNSMNEGVGIQTRVGADTFALRFRSTTSNSITASIPRTAAVEQARKSNPQRPFHDERSSKHFEHNVLRGQDNGLPTSNVGWKQPCWQWWKDNHNEVEKHWTEHLQFSPAKGSGGRYVYCDNRYGRRGTSFDSD